MKKMMTVLTMVLGLSAAFAQFSAEVAYACACCGEVGSYFRAKGPNYFEKEELQTLKLAGELNEGFGGAASGEQWKVEGVFKVDTLVLSVSRDGKELGEVRFKARAPYDIISTDFMTDDGPEAHGRQLKIVEMNGTASTNVPALKKIVGSKAVLVVKGIGNACAIGPVQWILKAPKTSAESGLYGHGKIGEDRNEQ